MASILDHAFVEQCLTCAQWVKHVLFNILFWAELAPQGSPLTYLGSGSELVPRILAIVQKPGTGASQVKAFFTALATELEGPELKSQLFTKDSL